MAPEEALSILEDIAAALAAAHAVGIVHRDVTPGNILLTPDGEARLTDFGIAHASGDTAAVTATGLVMGTMRYLAPEQLRGGASTAASDLHSLAAIAYEMLAGRPAYEATTPVALAEAQAAGPPPIDGLAPGIDAAVRRGLALDPVDRPADVGAFVAGVAAALSDQVTTAMPAAMVGVASPSRAADAHGPLPLVVGLRDRVRSDPPPHPRGGIRGIPAPVAVVLGLVVAVGLLAAATGLDMASSRGSAVTPSSIVAKDPPKAAATPQATAPPAKGHDHKGHGNDNGD